MSSPRPGSVTAAAVLSIIYGSLFTLCGLCGVVLLLAQGVMGKTFLERGDAAQQKLKKEIEEALQADVPGYQVVGAANKILGLGEAVALLCAGIGLLNLRFWARTLALWTCLVAISHTLFQAVYQSVFVLPALNRVFREVVPGILMNPRAAGDFEAADFLRLVMTLTVIAWVIVYVVLIVYLVIIMVLLCRRNVRPAFAAAAAAPPLDSGIPPSAYEDDPGWSTDPKDEGYYR